MTPLLIRAATSEDIPAILALERGSPLAAHWPESRYLQVFDKEGPTRIVLLAHEQEQPPAFYGFVVARIVAGECELENIVVGHQHQKCGIGSHLIRALAQAARDQNASRIFLEVRQSNAAARGLYERCGFVITGRRSSYYASPAEDAILYALSL